MFRGSSFHTIDPKGRVIVPARFRELLKNGKKQGAMISRLDQALVAYPFEEWQKIETRILEMAETSATMRRFRRVFIGGAFECNCDRQGRILIPPTLREYAVLDKEIVLVGVLDHFEIWSRANWDMENQEMELDMQNEEARTEIARLGL
jgi:MraZ protein